MIDRRYLWPDGAVGLTQTASTGLETLDGLVFSELTADWLEQAHELEHKTFFTVKSDDLYSLHEMAEDLAKLPGGNFMVVDPAAGHRLVGMGLGTLIDVDPPIPASY